MSIKQSAAALFILLSVSFSANAEYLEITSYGSNYHLVTGCLGVDVGDTVSVGIRSLSGNYQGGQCISMAANTSQVSVSWRVNGREHDGYMYGNASLECPDGENPNPDTGKCEPNYCEKESTIQEIESARNTCESNGGNFDFTCDNTSQTWESDCEGDSCKDVEGSSGDVTWDSKVWGSGAPSGYLCSSKGGGCGAAIDSSSSWCGESGWCYASFTVIGPECSVPDGPSFCSDPECKGFKDPDADPDDKPDTDPNHDPDDPTGDIEDPNKLPDTDADLTDPDDVDPEPDVEDPEEDETTDTAVVEAIKNMNKDVNGALHAMNVDVNASQANIINELKTLNAEVRLNSETIQNQQKNDNDIYENTKALIQQANADITTSVNKNTNAVNALKGSVDGIAEDVEGILDGITNTDTSGAGIGGTCIQSGDCKGFYNSGYPDGLDGLVSEQLEKLKINTIDNFVNSFGQMDLSNAKRPSFVLPVPFFGDFSFETYINFDWIFGFVRACLIMTSIFAARRIIFGG